MTTAVHEGFQRLTEAAESGRLAAVCSAFDIDVLVVFGSVVRCEEPRDLDVAVRFSSYNPARVLPLIDTLAAPRSWSGWTRSSCDGSTWS